MTDAIQTDATAAPGAPIPDLNDPSAHFSRAEAMKAMTARRREGLVSDMGPEAHAQFMATSTAAPVVDEDADTPAAKAETTSLLAAIDPVDVDEPLIDISTQVARQRGETTILNEEDLSRYQIRTKVNGREELVPLDRVRTGYQKTEAADAYLGQAAEMLAQVKSTLAQKAVEQVASGTTVDQSAPSEEERLITEAMNDMFQGNTDESAKKFMQVIKGRPAATPAADANQIAALVEARIVKDSALRQFRKDNKEIMADPTLRRVADTFLLEETAGQPLEALALDRIPEVLEAAGRRTKEWITKVSGVAPQPGSATTDRDERRAKKAQIDELPAASTRAASSVPPIKTASDRIAEMAKARGQLPG